MIVGTKVYHCEFGEGIVIEINHIFDQYVDVKFNSGEVKTINKAKLSVI